MHVINNEECCVAEFDGGDKISQHHAACLCKRLGITYSLDGSKVYYLRVACTEATKLIASLATDRLQFHLPILIHSLVGEDEIEDKLEFDSHAWSQRPLILDIEEVLTLEDFLPDTQLGQALLRASEEIVQYRTVVRYDYLARQYVDCDGEQKVGFDWKILFCKDPANLQSTHTVFGQVWDGGRSVSIQGGYAIG